MRWGSEGKEETGKVGSCGGGGEVWGGLRNGKRVKGFVDVFGREIVMSILVWPTDRFELWRSFPANRSSQYHAPPGLRFPPIRA